MLQTHKNRIELLANALESGEYKQGNFRLRANDEYCCLGVACDIYIKNVCGQWKFREHSQRYEFNIGYYYEGTYLPKQVMEWFGFSDVNPVLMAKTEDGCVGTASVLNDGIDGKNRKSFKQMAKLFRKLAEEKDATKI
jgi:hypothetical protein